VPSLEIGPRIRRIEGEKATLGSRSDGWMILHALANAFTSSAKFANSRSAEVLLSQKFSSKRPTSKAVATKKVMLCSSMPAGPSRWRARLAKVYRLQFDPAFVLLLDGFVFAHCAPAQLQISSGTSKACPIEQSRALTTSRLCECPQSSRLPITARAMTG
jgi:hypothetical protein